MNRSISKVCPLKKSICTEKCALYVDSDQGCVFHGIYNRLGYVGEDLFEEMKTGNRIIKILEQIKQNGEEEDPEDLPKE